MDISLLNTKTQSDAGSWVSLVDFDFVTPLDCEILVLGPDSEPAVAIADEESRAAQQRMFDSFSGKKAKAEDEEPTAEKDIKKAIRITKDWKNIQWDGVDFPCTEENKEKLYRFVPHIRTQVLAYYVNRLNFTPPGYVNWKKPSGQSSFSISRAKKAR